MINIKIRHELYQYHATPEEQKVLNDLINELLEPIMLDCITYMAWVDASITADDNYRITAKCDQYSTLLNMQSLLPELVPSFK